ncbi:Protein bimA [Cladobotryum mycophilum]|uniref:Protein bimA n=1 Tax=Cladobotryum mycophilum TaxID=491253 RepID=A0ABR0SA07_9HYPO
MDLQIRIVYDYLDDELNENVLFLTERLQALNPHDSTWAHLRALACLRLGRYALASEFSRKLGINGEHLGCSYVFAQACLQLKNYADGVTALSRAQAVLASRKQTCRPKDEPSHAERYLPDSSSLSRLLGKLHKASGDIKTAAIHFAAALEASPFMWDAFTDLCDSGMRIRISNIFKLRDHSSRNESCQKKPVKLAQTVLTNVTTRSRQPLESRLREPSKLPVQTSRYKSQITDENEPVTESWNVPNSSNPAAPGPLRMNIPVMSKKRLRSGLDHQQPAETLTTPSESSQNQDDALSSRSTSSDLPLAPPRRSARLLNQRAPFPALRENSLSDSGAPKRLAKPKNPGRLVEQKTPATLQPESADPAVSQEQKRLDRLPLIQTPKTATTPKTSCTNHTTPSNHESHEKLQPIMDLLQKLGSGYYHLTRFQPRTCLEAFTSLPVGQQATPWVLSKVGRAQYELMSYKEAKVTFQALRKLAPSWVEDMEVFSTVLWHLKEDIALAFLSHELSDNHYLLPQTWCAIGNMFSLQRSRKEAIKCFQRACQLSPRIAHSFSLLGYEYMEMEEFTEASIAFHQAIQVDPRHYSAWVGLGRVQERLGQSGKALEYYLGAEKINSHNAVLLTYIARMLDRAGRRENALTYIRRGIKLDPPSAVVGLLRMQAAGIHLRLRQPSEALRDLRLVEKIAADEPRVYFLLGKAYAMSGQSSRGAALKSYTTALSLAPWSDEIRTAIQDLNDAP